jgi:DNA polymerase-3 subunit epsilon
MIRGDVDYFVVDVETANQARHSICQIGIAAFSGGRMVDGWESLVDPEEDFSWFNIGVHGITPEMVGQSPSWSQLCLKVNSMLSGAAVASHTSFDRCALTGACERAGIPAVPYGKWIDTCWLARSAWPGMPNHKLPTLARAFRIDYKAHDALEDARVAGEVLALALEARQMTISELLASPDRHITGFPKLKPARKAAAPPAARSFTPAEDSAR